MKAGASASAGVEVLSLGCRLNIAESERIRTMLAGESELVVVNSCAVTAEAVRQTRQTIRRARRARPDARLLVTGCAADIERAQLTAMPEVDGLVPNASKLDSQRYGYPANARHDAPSPGEPLPAASLQSPPEGGLEARPAPHTRAFVGIQNGCDHACTFCIIPQGRGPSRSLPIGEVLQEVERHLVHGAPEIVLTGVDVTSWGHDLPGSPRLGALVRSILEAFPQLARLRMSSVDGVEIDPELFELLAAERRLMPHLHLSLQHGHDLVLKRMKRRHRRTDAIGLVERLRARRPELAIGADLIAGFPTEDETMHEANRSIIRELGIVHGHIFPYSPRPGTPAARMPQVEKAVIRRRAAELRAEVMAVRDRWLCSLLGREMTVLVENDGTGHAENFARVAVPEGIPAGAVVAITPTSIVENILR